jgi:hypothetical protein
MRQSKQLALMFLLGAALVGGVMGFSVDRMIVKDRLCPKVGDAKTYRERFADELGLSAAQRAAVDSILDARHQQIGGLLQPIRPQLDAISDSATAHIRRQLTEEQNAKFDAWRREMRQREHPDAKPGAKDTSKSETESGGAQR